MTEDQRIIAFMLECIDKIRRYTGGNRAVFFNDIKTQDATIHAITLLVDVSKRLSAEAKETMPMVAWNDMTGFRNYLVHEYLGDLDLEIVWVAIETKLDGLQNALLQYGKA
jgi:uncharacterized protein with HEPN domain